MFNAVQKLFGALLLIYFLFLFWLMFILHSLCTVLTGESFQCRKIDPISFYNWYTTYFIWWYLRFMLFNRLVGSIELEFCLTGSYLQLSFENDNFSKVFGTENYLKTAALLNWLSTVYNKWLNISFFWFTEVDWLTPLDYFFDW